MSECRIVDLEQLNRYASVTHVPYTRIWYLKVIAWSPVGSDRSAGWVGPYFVKFLVYYKRDVQLPAVGRAVSISHGDNGRIDNTLI